MRNAVHAAVLAGALFVAGAVIHAHVTVAPRLSQAGVTERYTVRVPTEGQVATTSVELEIPPGVIVKDVIAGDGYTFETRRSGDRIAAISWKKDIPPGGRSDFVFVATNPSAGAVTWKAHQHFADGTTVDWAGAPGDPRPASVTTLNSERK
jgi:uncharacterized protein YcnI